jgi:hypothetical protein
LELISSLLDAVRTADFEFTGELLAGKREEIVNKETEASQKDATAKFCRTQAESGRRLADSIRRL